MKLHLPVVLALLLFGSGCAAFSDTGTDTGAGTDAGGGSGGGGRIQVATAFYPLQFVVERVAGDLADVENLTSPGQEPHDLELTARQTAEIADADLVVLESDLQPAVADTVDQNAQGAVLEVEDVVDLQVPSHDGHDRGNIDPHFWQDPLLLAKVADAVADDLATVDPDDEGTFRANAAGLRAELTGLDTSYAAGLASCERTAVVVSHDAFGYLSRYGLDFYPIAGLSPDAEPTPADLARLQDLIGSEGITTVFGESLVSPRLAETLADDMGVTTQVLDPIEGLSEKTADQDYLSLMEQNLTALERANGCA